MSRVLVAEWWELWSGPLRIERSSDAAPEPMPGKAAFATRQSAVDARRRWHSPGYKIRHVRRYRIGQ